MTYIGNINADENDNIIIDPIGSCNITSSLGRDIPQNNVTAHAGGGQALATPLTSSTCRISIVASQNDSCILPNNYPINGDIDIRNDGSNAVDIFPSSGGQINALGTNAAYSLAVGSYITIFHFGSNQWYIY